MLNVSSSLLGAVEFVTTSLHSPNLVRLKRRQQNHVSGPRQYQNLEAEVLTLKNLLASVSSSPLYFTKRNLSVFVSSFELSRAVLLEHNPTPKNCDVDLNDLRRVGNVLFCGNYRISLAKNGNIAVQRRGFRTKHYEARVAEEKAKNQGFLQSFFEPQSKFRLFSAPLSKEQSVLNRLIDVPTLSAAKSVTSGKSLTEDQKVLLAFGEGYAANKLKPTAKSFGRYALYIAIGVMAYILLQSTAQFQFGTSIINEVAPEETNVTFNDVKGIEEAKEEVSQIVEYLKDPEKFTRLGARLPKGVLLVGLPGSGKTLLAKAIAGEAEVPFFRTSGSEFEEMLVGLGAKRVRQLFAAARSRAPCVIFIDEIDSIGSKRTYNALHPYANQTINQLLSEMDGFLSASGVIVLAATNRREDLDPALLRPGRFDVEIHVPWPDLKGRIEIFQLYLNKVKVDKDVNVESLAKATVGFSGADIENMVNQAALKAASDNKETVNMHYLDMAHDFVKMGPARKSRISDELVNKNTAYHEAGHALVAYFTKDTDPPHRVTIIPRGMSLGHTAYRPDKDMYQVTKAELLAMIDVLMGGRAAEELQFGNDKVTTGAADDMKKATRIAESFVKTYGMSEKIGLRYFDDEASRSYITVNEFGPSTSEALDSEIKRILQESYDRVKSLLKQHSAAHTRLAEALLKYETLDADEIKQIVEGTQPFTKKLT